MNRALLIGLAVAAAPLAGASLAQDQRTTVVAPLEVVPVIAPVPEVGAGAPLLSVGEIETARLEARRTATSAGSASRLCFRPTKAEPNVYNPGDPEHPTLAKLYRDAETANFIAATAADRASVATAQATATRTQLARGEGTLKAAEDAELARQAAVNRFLLLQADAREAQAVVGDRMQVKMSQLRNHTVPEEIRSEMARLKAERYFSGGSRDAIVLDRRWSGLELSQVTVAEATDEAGQLIRVSGRVRNPTARAFDMPPLSLTAVDQFGFALRTQISDPKRGARVPAGGETPFSYEFKPRPNAARSLLITFAAGRENIDPPYLGLICHSGAEWPKAPAGEASRLETNRGDNTYRNSILNGRMRGSGP